MKCEVEDLSSYQVNLDLFTIILDPFGVGTRNARDCNIIVSGPFYHPQINFMQMTHRPFLRNGSTQDTLRSSRRAMFLAHTKLGFHKRTTNVRTVNTKERTWNELRDNQLYLPSNNVQLNRMLETMD